jgi:cytochrome c-type biogenesis protein
MLTLGLAFLAGLLTTLSPCVLPILPVVLFGALDRHRAGPLALAAGLVVSFVLFALLLAGAGAALDISDATVRSVAAGLMIAFGLVLASRALQARFALAASSATSTLHGALDRAMDRIAPQGLAGQFGLGALLGAVWVPCSGPTLGAALGLAASSDTVAKAAAVFVVFGIGAVLPLVAIAYGSRQALNRRRASFARWSAVAQPWLGVVLVLAGALVLSGFDKTIEAAFVQNSPEWLVRLTTRF